MNRPTAPIVFTDEYHVIVICPYCDTYHKHGTTITTGESRSANCHKGEYILGDVISPRTIRIAVKRREADLERKRKPKTKSSSITSDTTSDIELVND